MITYKELKIQDNGFLFFHAVVEDQPYYEGIVITGARIDTPLTYGTDTPYEVTTAMAPTTELVSGHILPPKDQQLLIVTPIIEGAPSYDTPCGKDVIDIGIVYNKKHILEKGLGYLKELGESCSIPKGFVDYILRAKALDMAIATCNYAEAIKYWNYLTKRPIKTSTNNCGCHGLN